jgi:hypothetical protein
MSERPRISEIMDQGARRRAALDLIGEYHSEQLRSLLDRVRDGFKQMDSGEISPFELDDIIHHYKRSAQKLWSFCGSSGASSENAALAIERWRDSPEDEMDWWQVGSPRR